MVNFNVPALQTLTRGKNLEVRIADVYGLDTDS